ncbi:hypothetical protein Tco_0251516 [Tanacetum coccineum]
MLEQIMTEIHNRRLIQFLGRRHPFLAMQKADHCGYFNYEADAHTSGIPHEPQTDSSLLKLKHLGENLGSVIHIPVSEQAKEIPTLECSITSSRSKLRPVIKHHRALAANFAKGESSVQRDPLFDEIPEDTIFFIDHLETRECSDDGEEQENWVDED